MTKITAASRIVEGAIPVVGCAALIALGRTVTSTAAARQDRVPDNPGGGRHRGAKALVAMGAASALVALAGGGMAWAYFKGGSGTGSGTAATASASVIGASNASLSGALYPGSSLNITVTVTNPYPNMSLSVTGLAVPSTSGSVTGGSASCPASNVSLVTTASFPATTIAASSSQSVTFTGAITMSASAPNACQGLSFTVPAAVTTKVG